MAMVMSNQERGGPNTKLKRKNEQNEPTWPDHETMIRVSKQLPPDQRWFDDSEDTAPERPRPLPTDPKDMNTDQIILPSEN